MSSPSASNVGESLGQRVERLLAVWRAETAPLSSSTARHAHPAYQELIRMGEEAVPFLLHDLRLTRDGHLSKALTAITGAHPVPPEARGRIREVAEAWLRWAEEHGPRG